MGQTPTTTTSPSSGRRPRRPTRANNSDQNQPHPRRRRLYGAVSITRAHGIAAGSPSCRSLSMVAVRLIREYLYILERNREPSTTIGRDRRFADRRPHCDLSLDNRCRRLCAGWRSLFLVAECGSEHDAQRKQHQRNERNLGASKKSHVCPRAQGNLIRGADRPHRRLSRSSNLRSDERATAYRAIASIPPPEPASRRCTAPAFSIRTPIDRCR